MTSTRAALLIRSVTAVRSRPVANIFRKKSCAAWPRTTPRSWERTSTAKFAAQQQILAFASPREKRKVVRLGLKNCRMLAVAILCGLLSAAPSPARTLARQSSPQSQTAPAPESPSAPPPTAAQDASAAAKAAQDQAAAKPDGSKTAGKPAAKPFIGTRPSAARKPSSSQAHAHAAAVKSRKHPLSPRVRRMREAFVDSATLRPMAQQLIQDRSLAAYAGVEAYAKAHSKEDAGALAWLVVGYAHVLDHDYAKAIDP